jgi:hypothetical protein
VPADPAAIEPLSLRVALVLGALATFVLASEVAIGAPPTLPVTVLFGAVLGLALEAQAQSGAG